MKTPINALREKIISLGYSPEHQYSLFCAFDEFEKEEKAFAFDCFNAGGKHQISCMFFSGLQHETTFKQFYSQYAEKHNK